MVVLVQDKDSTNLKVAIFKEYMTQLSKKGSKGMWKVLQRQIKPNDINPISNGRLKILINATFDLLPTLCNESRWYGTEKR